MCCRVGVWIGDFFFRFAWVVDSETVLCVLGTIVKFASVLNLFLCQFEMVGVWAGC